MKCWVGVFLLFSLACILPSLIFIHDGESQTATRNVPTLTPASSEMHPEVTPFATFTVTPLPVTSTPWSQDPRLDRNHVLILPQPLFAGDRLTVDVDPRIPDFQPHHYTVTLDLMDGRSYTSPIVPVGLTGKPQARFYWLDPLKAERATAILTVTLTVGDEVVDPIPENNRVVVSESIYPSTALLPPEPEARWGYTETEGCRLHYLIGSAADRDLLTLMTESGAAYRHVTARLKRPADPVEIYIMDRVVGQGGYASSDWIAFSYTDRKYAPITLSSVLKHELTHRLDEGLGCDTAPSFVREGLAVYVAGGHYEPESLRQRAAALLASEHYIPLTRLVNDFYAHQHEAGYWEAGAFVQYLVETYGWDSISEICKVSAHRASDDHEREFEVFVASVSSLGIGSFAEIERAWEDWLADSEVLRMDLQLIEGKLQLMDRMRAYQKRYDTAAHFTEGVLFSPAEAARLGIVADFIRRPRQPETIAIELLLALGYEAFLQRDLVILNLCLDSIDSLLNRTTSSSLPDPGSDLADEIVALVARALRLGYEPYQLLMEGPERYRIQVLDLGAWPQKREMVAVMDSGEWVLQ